MWWPASQASASELTKAERQPAGKRHKLERISDMMLPHALFGDFFLFFVLHLEYMHWFQLRGWRGAASCSNQSHKDTPVLLYISSLFVKIREDNFRSFSRLHLYSCNFSINYLLSLRMNSLTSHSRSTSFH